MIKSILVALDGSQHADSALPTRYGAGLYGVPTLACEQPSESESAEPASDESEGD